MSTRNIALGILGAILIVIVAVFASSTMDRRGGEGDVSVVTSSQPGSAGDAAQGGTGTTTGQPDTGAVTVTARLNAPATALNMTVTPLEVVEDSRCPSGVQCIQAGTVRVRVRVASGLGTSEQVIALGGTMTTEAESVTLTAVSPYPASGGGIPAADYRFTFELERR